MKFCCYDILGKITQTGDIPSELITSESFAHFTDNVLLDIPSDVTVSTHYVNNGQLVVFPIKPSDFYEWDWLTQGWVLNIEAARTAKALEINDTCKFEILSGFESDALGVIYHYPAKITDQQNLASSVLASLLPGLSPEWTTPFWCADAQDVWGFRSHSAAQIQQVGQDAKQSILWAMSRNEQLQLEIKQANSIEQLDSIIW